MEIVTTPLSVEVRLPSSVMPLAYTGRVYCSKTDKSRREVCVPLGNNRKFHLADLKVKNIATYALRITDLEGNQTTISASPLAQAIFE